MSSSRESSPDWLRSFQAPSHSPLTLSSDSESLHDGNSSNEDKSGGEGSSPKSPKLPKAKEDEGVAVAGSSARSSSRKTLKVESLEIEEQTLTRRKKSDKLKENKGNKEEKKIVTESKIDEHIEHKESIHSIWTLSSDSEPCHDHSPKREDHIDLVETSQRQISQILGEGEYEDGLALGKDEKSPSKKGSKEKSSEKQIDTEDCTPVKDGKSPSKKGSKEKPSQKQIDTEGCTPVKGKKIKSSAKGKGNDGDVEAAEEETSEKLVEPNVSSSMLPLMLSEKVHRTKALIECQGDSIDLSGDMGAVGRIIISDAPSGDQEMSLDLKGTIYKTSIVPCRTFCVVSFGQSEAKIEAVMNDFIQLKPHSNVYEAETMVEGTLDGFFFDSDEEAGKMPKAAQQTDENEHAEEQTNGKSKGKTDKSSGAVKKRGRSTGGKSQPKIVKKKAPGSKRAKTKK